MVIIGGPAIVRGKGFFDIHGVVNLIAPIVKKIVINYAIQGRNSTVFQKLALILYSFLYVLISRTEYHGTSAMQPYINSSRKSTNPTHEFYISVHITLQVLRITKGF
ncbi:MAG: hypothetical protein ACI9EW_001472 [Cellvibrionaceae bacterium]|jgi:hypothetical protein